MGKYHRFGRIAPMYPKSRLVKMAFSFVRNLRRCRCGRGPAYLLFFKRIVSGEESLWLLLVLFGDVCGCRLKLVDLTQLMAEIWAILRNVLTSFSKMTLNCGNAYGRTIPSQRVAWPFWSPTRGITCGGPLSRARSKTQRTQQRKAMPMRLSPVMSAIANTRSEYASGSRFWLCCGCYAASDQVQEGPSGLMHRRSAVSRSTPN